MPRTTIIRKRGTTVVIEAWAEVTAGATGPLGKWATEFRTRLEKNTRDAAPWGVKRPHWKHQGSGLKNSFSGAIKYNPVKGRVDLAVGSSADYALYVDQGTGIYNGGAPWRAKILPPWKRGEGSLYEATWIPPGLSATVGGRHRVKPVWIKGQKPQNFMQRGMDRTMQSMRNRYYQLPADPRAHRLVPTAPRSLSTFIGGTPNYNGAFRAELEQWRAWRDKAWFSGKELGNKGARKNRREIKKNIARMRARRRRGDFTPLELTDDQLRWRQEAQDRWERNRAERRRENARRYRERNRESGRKPDRSLARDRAREREVLMTQLRKQYVSVEYGGFHDGKFMFIVKDGRDFRILRVTPKSTSRGRRRTRGW